MALNNKATRLIVEEYFRTQGFPMLTNSRDIIRRLMQDGWVLDRVRGSHHIFKRKGNRDQITLQHPEKDLGVGLVLKIYRIAGWQKD